MRVGPPFSYLEYKMTVKNQNGLVIIPKQNKERVIRICDSCELEETIDSRSAYVSRHKRKSEKDFCNKCVRELAAVNRRKKDSYESRGYAYRMDSGSNRQIMLHIEKMEEFLGRKLTETEVVHHIDKDKKNNNIENLCVYENQNQHGKAHQQLENIAVDLYKKGFIGFDREKKEYYLKHDIIASMFEKSYGFESVAIKQKKNICNSRLDANIESEIIRGFVRPVPLIASNMNTVVNSSFCIKLYEQGAFGIMHRAADEAFLLKEIEVISRKCEWTAASIGIEQDQLEFAKKLLLAGANIICIDVAHGYSDRVMELGRQVKNLSNNVKLILGNTTNTEMFKECSDFADAIKVGIAQGFACETKNTAGCTEKQFSAVLKFKELSKIYGIPVISDGGIREPADFTKAIAAGASSVMAGKIFASCVESAAKEIEVDGKIKKLYAGMASAYIQEQWKGGLKSGTCAEGGIRYLDIDGNLSHVLERYSGALRSGITYAGGNDIKTFQSSVEFTLIC